MLAPQTDGPLARGARTRPTLQIHATQSSTMARLDNMNAASSARSPVPTSSSTFSLLTPSSPRLTLVASSVSSTVRSLEPTKPSDATFLERPTHRREPLNQQSPSTPGAASSSSLSEARTKPVFEYIDYSSFFDGYASQEASKAHGQEEEDRSDPTTLSFQFSFNEIIDDDQEDLKDLRALNFTKSIRMNLEALTRSSADHYAYNAEGYADLNVPFAAKAVEHPLEASTIENQYADLISKLSFTEDGSGEGLERPRRHIRSYEQLEGEHAQDTPISSFWKDSPTAASLASARSSSETPEEELRTPPEPSFEGFEPSTDPLSIRSKPRRPVRRSPIRSQQDPHASSPGQPAAELHQLRSPFQHLHPEQPQAQYSLRNLHHAELPDAIGRYEIGNSSELELLSDDVNAQRRAAGQARVMPRQRESSTSSQTGHVHSGPRSPAEAVVDSNKPFTRLAPHDVAFSAATLPELRLTASDCVDIITSRYPSLCDAPLREFGEDGQPLPPTKKQETSEEERQARRQALRVRFCAKQHLSLIKAMVVMESRSASWRRLGPFNPDNKNVNPASEQLKQQGLPASSSEMARLPPMPSPWTMEIRHEQLDVAQMKPKTRKTIELESLRINALCDKCQGSGFGSCVTCKAEKADECFWCSGTGREKTRVQAWCRRCQGAGVLKCNTCHGSLRSGCRSCHATGAGEYGFFVDVTVKRVEMPAVPISTLFPRFDSAPTAIEPTYDEVKVAATMALWDSITKLSDARSHTVAMRGGKAKNKQMVPVMAACVWENSITHVVAVDVPLAAKFKKGSVPALRPEGLHRRIPTTRRFFTVPNDADLRSVELSEDEVKQLASARPIAHVHRPNQLSPTRSPMQSQSSLASPFQSPIAGSVELGAYLPLATPEERASVSGFSTPSRVSSPRFDTPAASPVAREFAHRPSPLSQLTPVTPSPLGVQQHEPRPNYFETQSHPTFQFQHIDSSVHFQEAKARSPSAGQVLTKKPSSSFLTKLGAHRGSN